MRFSGPAARWARGPGPRAPALCRGLFCLGGIGREEPPVMALLHYALGLETERGEPVLAQATSNI